MDIELGSGATLDLYRLQHLGARTFHTERLDAHLAADARLFVRDASLGGTLARMDLFATLDGPNAAVEATGLFLADGSRHLDTQVRVDHRAVATTSLQEYRGIAAGRGRGVFNTKVVVHPGAQKTNARHSTATCCSRRCRSTRSWNSRSTRTTCSAATAPPRASRRQCALHLRLQFRLEESDR
jgi:Fe-S cluster assembly protein SufD